MTGDIAALRKLRWVINYPLCTTGHIPGTPGHWGNWSELVNPPEGGGEGHSHQHLFPGAIRIPKEMKVLIFEI